MNILFLTIGNIKNIGERGIYTDLVREFIENGHNVHIVHPLEKRLNRETELIENGNTKVLKVKVGNITKVNLIEKGVSTLQIENIFLKNIKKHFKEVKFDLVLYSTPPITFEKVIRYIKKRDNAKSYLLLKDIFPQNAVDLNMFSKNSIFYKYFRRKEVKLYANSDYIGCMSKENKNYILNNNDIDRDKIEICPNTITPIKLNSNKNSNLREKYNIPLEKTVFLYGGNIGKPQGVDFILDCLDEVSTIKEAFFLIVGSGTEISKIQKYLAEKQPINIQLINHLPKNDYDLLVGNCDVGLIFLDYRFTIPNFPSRLLSYMEANMPVLAATDKNTDIGTVIEDGMFGFWCESTDAVKFKEKVQLLCNPDLRTKLGKNARVYLENNYTSKHAYKTIIKHFI